MAYSLMPVLAAGNQYTHTHHNQVADNFAAGVPDIFTAAGDLAVATGADVAIPLPIGLPGQLLITNTALAHKMNWANAFSGERARCKKSADQSIPHNTLTIVNFETVVFDPNSRITTGAAWKFTVPTGGAGKYLVAVTVELASSASWTIGESAELRLLKSASAYSTLHQVYAHITGTYGMILHGCDIMNLADADYITARVLQTSGAAINVTDGVNTHIAIAKVAS